MRFCQDSPAVAAGQQSAAVLLVTVDARTVRPMVDDERYRIDVLTQISAVQAALDKVALGLLDDHARPCVMGAGEDEQPDKTAELMAAVGRLMRRG